MPKPEDPNEYIKKAKELTVAALGEGVKNELNDQGFPPYMACSFIETAKATNSIILSRLPGGVGTDLIEEGYDLKGFHIKAKSCNWGPMAGFICQLPVFNKLGIDKVLYNTKEIVHYLHHLDNFSLAKTQINGYETSRKTEIDATPANKAEINRRYDSLILEVLTTKRTLEQKSGEWSGENGLEGDRPFIPLRRKFKDLAAVKEMRGVDGRAIEITPGKLIYGIAQNVTDEDVKANSKPTVVTEFLLEKGEDGVWDIYHGRIKYKSKESDINFDKAFPGTIIKDLIKGKLTKTPDPHMEVLAEEVFLIKAPNLSITKDQLNTINEFNLEYGIFPHLSYAATFNKVHGFVNPFPPFPKPKTGKPDLYYKNAVSGDYDLFGVWPSIERGQADLARQSELTFGKFYRIGGKPFTTYLGNKNNFAIEFVPGFKELNPSKDKPDDILKESAEFGNMNSLVHLVSGLLNSFAASFITALNPEKESTANKGFHSDEGGRPGIMEVEFPIAVFFPKKTKTRALNNLYHDKRIPKLDDRIEVSTMGGLLKSPAELVVFMLECMRNDYCVYMHYRWMIHLLYNIVPQGQFITRFKRVISENIEEIKRYNKDFDINAEQDYLKEFIAIDKNRAVIDAKMPAYDSYTRDLLEILGCENDKSAFAEKLLDLLLLYYFLADKLSFEKKLQFEGLMYKTRIKTTI